MPFIEMPDWLKDDVRELALENVRISCAMYELYNKYAMTKTPDLGVDERLEYLEMVNERLDFIDDNIYVIKLLIKGVREI